MGGYMRRKVQGKHFSDVRDCLASFVKKPCPTEPGYKADCWSLEHVDPEARGKPKDGAAALVGFSGRVYMSAVQLNHAVQRFRMEGGTKHRAALGVAEYMYELGQSGVIMVRS